MEIKTDMRILVEPSDYKLWNAGDTAMLQVTVTRLAEMWPNAKIQILSDLPDCLPAYGPNAQPLDSKGRRLWYKDGFLGDRFESYLPSSKIEQIWKVERLLRRRWPSFVAFILKLKLKLAGYGNQELNDFLQALSKADLVIAAGMGGITDVFPKYAIELLDTLRLAMKYGAITAMVGQGIGPISDSELRTHAKSVLPHINFISLRENRTGGPLLRSLGVAPDRMLTTGDDAIELAHKLRSEQLGNGLGVNLRVANYSEINQNLIEQLRLVVQGAAKMRKAPMVSIPISRVPGEEDALNIRQLTAGYHTVLDQGEQLDAPPKVIKQIQLCRLVIIGSYHAAVFALAQGIPAVCLAKSDYYIDKFLGLAHQFGAGCKVILLQDDHFQESLTAAIESLWESAELVRPKLLEAAEQQIELSHKAYERIYELVRNHKSSVPRLKPRALTG